MISKTKKNAIEEKILNGYLLSDIVQTEKVSISTIKRIKNGLVQTNPQLAEVIDNNKYTKKHVDSQAKELNHLNELKRKYEDTEEGWVYDAAVEEYKSKRTSRTFAGIVYGLDEEKKKDLANLLEAKGFSGEISPIHDRDIWSHDSPAVIDETTGEVIEEAGSRYHSGDRKKSHNHVMIQLDQPITYRKFNEMIHRILPDTPMWIMVGSIKGQHNYFTHHTEAAIKAGKYLYEESEMLTFGCFEMTLTKRDRQLIISMLAGEIVENKICYMSELVERHNHIPEEIGIIKDCSFFFKSLIDEQWRKANPEGRISRTKVMSVKTF